MSMSYTEEQNIMSDILRSFAAEKLTPFAQKWEDEKCLSRDILKEMANLGLGGIYVDSNFGGSELSRFDGILIFQELARGCISHAAFLSIHNMAARMIDNFGSQLLKEKYLNQICAMDKIISYCLTEPNSGSDAASLTTNAIKTDNGFILNGTKTFISGAGFSDLYLVMARTGQNGANGISAFIVEKGTKGLSFGKNELKMGWRAQPTAQVIFENCEISQENLLGEIGQGFRYAMAGLDGGRLNIAACALGGAKAAFELALNYSQERAQFGKKIWDFQNTQFKLADMATNIEASSSLLELAAQKLDAKTQDATKFCAMAKRFVTDNAFNIANEALQIHGGYGYLNEYQIERIVRDLRVHQILEGTNEIMRLIIARSLIK